MPVESGVIDTNVLVYALDADAPQHATSRALLEAARAGQATLYVTSQILCEFYAVVTNPRMIRSTISARVRFVSGKPGIAFCNAGKVFDNKCPAFLSHTA